MTRFGKSRSIVSERVLRNLQTEAHATNRFFGENVVLQKDLIDLLKKKNWPPNLAAPFIYIN